MTKYDVRISEKYLLTVEEAAAYFSIGRERLRSLIRENPSSDWILYVGSQARIKRRLFEQLLDGLSAL